MRLLIFLLVVMMFFSRGEGQRVNIDSLKQCLRVSRSDFAKARLTAELGRAYSFINPDSGLYYSQRTIDLSRSLHFTSGEAEGMSNYGWNLSITGNFPLGIEYAFKALDLYQDLKDSNEIGYTYIVLNFNFRELGDYAHAVFYGHKALEMFYSLPKIRTTSLGSYKKIALAVLGETYERMNLMDSALIYIRKAKELEKQERSGKWNVPTFVLAKIYFKLHYYDSARYYYWEALQQAHSNNIQKDIVDIQNCLSGFYLEKGRLDSAMIFAKKAMQLGSSLAYSKGKMEAISNLAQVFIREKQNDSAVTYLSLRELYHDSLFNQEKERHIQSLVFSEQSKVQQITELKEKMQQQKRMIITRIAVASIILCIIIGARIYFLKQQIKLQKLRNQISRDLHDELGSSLGGIHILSHTLQENITDTIPKDHLQVLHKISRMAQHSLEAIDDMVWSVNPYKDTVEDLFLRMKEFAYPLAEARNIHLVFSSEWDNRRKLGMTLRKDVFLLFKEAYINALKYSASQSITISVSFKKNLLHLKIEDDGKGFDPEEATVRNGVKNMCDRAKKLKGQLSIDSFPLKGTTVYLVCPIL